MIFDEVSLGRQADRVIKHYFETLPRKLGIKSEDIQILADNISEETYSMIQKYIPKQQIELVNIGNGAGTFHKTLDSRFFSPFSFS